MATWVRNGTGTAPTSTDAPLSGRYSLDNGTAPSDFDPAGVTSVQIAYTITGSGFAGDTWDDLRAATLDDATNTAATINGTDNTGLQNTTSNTSETDSSPNTGLSTAQWEAMAVSGGTTINGNYTGWTQDKGKDGGVQTMSALTVTITYTPGTPTDVDQTNFRGRLVNADTAGANAAFDASDPAVNADFTINTDTPFRIRFEVDNAGLADTVTPRLYYRVNTGAGYGAWTVVPTVADAWPMTTDIALALVNNYQASGFTDGTATTNLISGSTETFDPGTAEHNNNAPDITLASEHTEWEFSLIIPRWYDTGSNDDGDLYQFRIQDDTVALDTYTNTPTVTVNVPDGHIGGVYIEQPSNIIHVDGNGNIYVFTEQTTQNNDLMVHKSSDGGTTWAEIDGANRPTTPDPEGVDIFPNPNVTGEILIATRRGNEDVHHHIFRTSDHATNADTWGTVDQVVDTAQGADIIDTDSVAIVARDHTGTLFKFVFFTAGDGTNERVYWNYHNGTAWQTTASFDATASTNFTAVSAIYEPNNDVIRVYYMDHSNGDMYMKTLASGSTTPSARTQIATNVRTTDPGPDRANLVPAVVYDDAGVDVSMYGYTRDATLLLSTEHLRDGTQQGEVTSVNDNNHDRSNGASHQPVATFAVDGTTVYLMYSDNADQDIYYDSNADEAGWGTDIEEKDAVTCHYIRAKVFTHSSGNGGAKVLGYVWDQGSNGFAGFVRYDEIILEAGGTVFPPYPRRQLTTVRM